MMTSMNSQVDSEVKVINIKRTVNFTKPNTHMPVQTHDTSQYLQNITTSEYNIYHCHVNENVFKQSPHMRAGVDFLHLDLGVNVAVIQEVDVCCLHLFTDNKLNITLCNFVSEV